MEDERPTDTLSGSQLSPYSRHSTSRTAIGEVTSRIVAGATVVVCLHYVSPMLICDGPLATKALYGMLAMTMPALAFPVIAIARKISK